VTAKKQTEEECMNRRIMDMTMAEQKVVAYLLNKYQPPPRRFWTAFNVIWASTNEVKDAVKLALKDKKVTEFGMDWIERIKKGVGA